MSYASQADLVTRFGAEELTQLTDRTQAGVPDATVVTAALTDADALIDSYVSGRYAVPVTPTPELLRRLAADIARHLLHGKSATGAVRDAYEDALKVLEGISRGTASLVGAAPPARGAATGGPVLAETSPRIFTPDTLADYRG